jgi:glycosyltransferase involved in cell wall biosynthesis
MGQPQTQFHLVSFEGPDGYARAGGLATRVDGLARALAAQGADTHVWFVGDPDLSGYERREGVHLHRWCQWISASHRGGVYDGEQAKIDDFAHSLPPYLLDQVLGPHLAEGGSAALLAEEWHTVGTVLNLASALEHAGLRARAPILWNANNVFGFERIDWRALGRVATVTTVSRWMRFRMEALGTSPAVISNGLPADAFERPDPLLVNQVRKCLTGRLSLAKIARWDPDKNWLHAIAATQRARQRGMRPLLIARGGAEAHGGEVRAAAHGASLRWVDRDLATPHPTALMAALEDLDEVDVVCLRSSLEGPTARLLLRAVDAVLANSRFEPFGLVGLETMAVEGVACTGITGEDYAIPGRNAIVLQSEDPDELAGALRHLHEHPEDELELRRAARVTARQYSWDSVVRRVLLPRIELARQNLEGIA